MFCNRCGAELGGDYAFCTGCGTPVQESSRQPVSPPDFEPGSGERASAAPTSQPPSSSEPRNKAGRSSHFAGAEPSARPAAATLLVRVAFIGLSVLLVLLASFGIAIGVVEWRGESFRDYIDCTNDALQKSVDASEELRANRPIAPDAPSSGASDAAFDTYQRQFDQYEKEFDRYLDRGDEISQEYDEDVRACAGLLD